MVRVENRVLFLRCLKFFRLPLYPRRIVVNLVMHFGQEGRGSFGKPAPSAELERAEVTTPVCGTQKGIRVLFEFLVGDCCLGRYLIESYVLVLPLFFSSKKFKERRRRYTYRVVFSIDTQKGHPYT